MYGIFTDVLSCSLFCLITLLGCTRSALVRVARLIFRDTMGAGALSVPGPMTPKLPLPARLGKGLPYTVNRVRDESGREEDKIAPGV